MSTDLTYVHKYTPGQGDNRDVTLLLLHGTGGTEDDLQNLGEMFLPGSGQLRPRGNVPENGMARFFRRFAEGVLDVDDLKQRTQELADFVQVASTRYGFSIEHVIAVGFSNGANIAASMLFLRPDMLQSAVLLHPMMPFVPEKLPDLRGKRVFMGAGKFDPICPIEQTEQLGQLLEQAGADVSLFWHDGGHNVSVEEVKAAQAWFGGFRV